MSPEGGGPGGTAPKARLFVALELPRAAREALVAWRDEQLPAGARLRLIDVGSLHVTLCFLGWRAQDEIEALASIVERAAGPARGLALGGPVWLPPRRPRVLAVELQDPAGELVSLQGRLSRALSQAGAYTPEKRPYLPHVTVARVPSGARPPAGPLPGPEHERFDAGAVTLYRSRLERAGARYEALLRAAI